MKVLLEAIVGCECTVMSCRAIVGSGDDHAADYVLGTCIATGSTGNETHLLLPGVPYKSDDVGLQEVTSLGVAGRKAADTALLGHAPGLERGMEGAKLGSGRKPGKARSCAPGHSIQTPREYHVVGSE
ncbi:predicted protein [Plenodomus lingam JN3]|uniref:Predicted protein n=1 Tax=Leptosphaeria maculans (strain JN3 / isolate v23.1.3 / race Av1-4-5-6-7-8) TaxID=985895 RepID=E5A3V2_LEPMJ|nr:predicted protein [Plenodomus lingam JN3]CBX97976.1 predicted protein [Plenodomus lingam JN3]